MNLDFDTSVSLHLSLAAAPAAAAVMPARPADPRVGFFSTCFEVLGADARGGESPRLGEQDAEVCLAQRWRLEPAEPGAPCPAGGCAPAKPITYHLDTSIPDKWRPCFRHGVEAWDEAFRAAGWAEGTVRAVSPGDADWPADYDAADMRFSSVTWAPSLQSVYSVGPSTVDPRSGEILNADIVFAESWVRSLMGAFAAAPASQQAEQRAAGGGGEGGESGRGAHEREHDHGHEHGGGDSSGQRRRLAARAAGGGGDERVFRGPRGSSQCFHGHGDDSAGALASALFGGAARAGADAAVASPFATVPARTSTDFVCEALAQITMHEVGHTLGLRHNFAASTAFTKEQLKSKEFIEANGLSGSIMDYLVRCPKKRRSPLPARPALPQVMSSDARFLSL